MAGVIANVAINVETANAVKELNRVKNAVDGTSQSLNRLPQATQKLGLLKNAVMGLAAQLTAGYTAAKIFAESLNTAFTRGAAEQKLKNLTGSVAEYEAALALARKQVQIFGMTQTEATVAIGDIYSRLRGVGFGLKEVGEIYTGFNTIVTMSGVTSQDAAGAFYQLSQALGKGKLNGDEFIAVSERMPQLLDMIASTTGVARGQLAEMAGQGQITSDVLYKALSQAAKGAVDLNSKLTDQQVAMSNLKVAADKVLYLLGSLFGPYVTRATQLFANALNAVADAMPYIQAGLRVVQAGFDNLMNVAGTIARTILPAMNAGFQFIVQNFKEIATVATFFASLVGIFQAVTIATKGWTAATIALAVAKKAAAIAVAVFEGTAAIFTAITTATKGWTAATLALAVAKKVAAVAAAALQAIMNPGNLAKVAIAIAGATAASYALAKAMDAAAKGIKGVTAEQDNQLDLTKQNLNAFTSLPPVIQSTKDKQKELKEETKRFKEEVDLVKLAYEGVYKAQEEGLNRMENTIKIVEERVKAETAVRDLIKDQLQSQLDQAKTQEQRVEIARRIYDIEIANAKSALAIALQQIDYEIRRAQIVAGTQQLKVQELKTEIAIARARNQTTTELEKALVSQQSAFKIAMQNVEAVEESAKYQKQQAEAIFKSKEFAAKLAFEQNKTAKETAKAATSAHTLADGMERAGAAAEKTAEAANKIAFLGRKTEGTPFAAMGGAGAIEDPALQKQATKIFENAQKFATGKDFRIQQDIFQRARDEIAQLALRDYAARTKVATLTTVPSPAPATFPAPGASEPTVSGLSMQPGGGPGTAVVDRMPSTINLQTGPVLQQDDGSKYVSLGDLEKILQDFAAVVFNNARSAGGRRFQGVN